MSTTQSSVDAEPSVSPSGNRPSGERRSEVLVVHPREVPLGGPRAMSVRRTLPSRDRAFVGAWCFVDHYGPDPVMTNGGMDVPPHPHAGLQTVSWLFEGTIEHRDSGGVHGLVRPGEVNLMTAGAGISHSEVSTPDTSVLHGVQLWIVLPLADREAARDFQHYAAPLVEVGGGVRARVFMGALAGQESPVTTFTSLLGAELELDPGVDIELAVDPAFEHALLVDRGSISFCGTALEPGDLGIVDAGAATLTVRNNSDQASRALLLGGVPFEEQIVMWWNFIGTDDAEIRRFREQWQAGDRRFGEVWGYVGEPQRLNAPPLPSVRLRPRGRRGRRG